MNFQIIKNQFRVNSYQFYHDLLSYVYRFCSRMYFVEIFMLFVISCKFVVCFNLNEGDVCLALQKNLNTSGICSDVRACPWALTQIKQRFKVEICSFEGKNPIICCPKPAQKYGYGAISSAKCDEFYPGKVRFAIGGTPSLAQEFPHMALLGYGLKNDIQWGCGGSLISLQHVLTAAHCLSSRDFGDVKYVRLGDLDIKNNSDVAEPQDFSVTKAITHPDYNARTSKNDIAILKLDRKIKITLFVKPACLHVVTLPKSWRITASGWGITEFAGEPSSHLMKVELKILENSECRKQYAKAGFKSNIDEKMQICADSADSSRLMDTCQGDSGGPLQVVNTTTEKHYRIIGVTSYGKACGLSRSAGIYTRVSYYVPWIESIVWKDSII